MIHEVMVRSCEKTKNLEMLLFHLGDRWKHNREEQAAEDIRARKC